MKRTLLILAFMLSPYAHADNHGAVAAEIEDLVRAFNGAYESNDYETYFSFYTEDASLYFFGQRQVVADYYESWSAGIEAGAGVDKYELSDIRVQVLADGKAAIATYFIVGTSHTADGEPSTVNAYESDVWHKIDGEWKIVSLHYTEH